MPSIRSGFGSDFVLKSEKIGIGSETPTNTLDVDGAIKGNLSIAVWNATDKTIPTAFGHFDDLIKSFVKESESVLGSYVQPDLPKMKKKQVGQTFSNPFFEK